MRNFDSERKLLKNAFKQNSLIQSAADSQKNIWRLQTVGKNLTRWTTVYKETVLVQERGRIKSYLSYVTRKSERWSSSANERIRTWDMGSRRVKYSTLKLNYRTASVQHSSLHPLLILWSGMNIRRKPKADMTVPKPMSTRKLETEKLKRPHKDLGSQRQSVHDSLRCGRKPGLN